MEKVCDNTSVGVIIQNEAREVLLMNRARFPFGLAAPAGHIDTHGSPEQTATAEVYEEVGLYIPLSGLEKLIDARKVDNKCRRKGGDHHIWTVFSARNISGHIVASKDETKGAGWYAPEVLQVLADRTRQSTGKETHVGAQVLELIWLDFFTELGFVTE